MSSVWAALPAHKSTIHRKIMIGFIAIFILTGVGLYMYLSHILEAQTKAAIAADMKKLQQFTYDYIRQYVLTEQDGQADIQPEMDVFLRSLSLSAGISVAYYDNEGQFWGEARPAGGGFSVVGQQQSPILGQSASTDVAAAMSNQSIVTIHQEYGSSYAILTLPMYLKEQLRGILRLTTDYTDRYGHHAAVLRSIGWFTLGLFVLVFLLTMYTSRRITKPLARLSAALIRFGEGRHTGTLSIDSNDEVGALARSFEQMREQIERQLAMIAEEKNRIAALEQSRRQFYQHVTHELKTPLTTISGYAQIIGRPGFDDFQFLHKAARKIQAESHRLHEMVVEVIELSRLESAPREGAMQRVDLSGELVSCVEDMQLKAAKYKMSIRCNLQPVFICGQPEELHKVWINILDNAIKYGKEGGVIEVAVHEQAERAAIIVTNEASPAQSPADTQFVFEPFYRRSDEEARERGSVGLGLAICKPIVAYHKGSISYRDKDGQVTVKVQLPICE